MYRDISAGQEVTLYYEAGNADMIGLSEMIGGSYPPRKCNCGSWICCGDILRRVLDLKTVHYDHWFVSEVTEFGNDKTVIDLEKIPGLMLKMHAIHMANMDFEKYCTTNSCAPSHDSLNRFIEHYADRFTSSSTIGTTMGLLNELYDNVPEYERILMTKMEN